MPGNGVFQVKVAVAVLWAPRSGITVPYAAITFARASRTSTTTCTFFSVETLLFTSVASTRGIVTEPPCIVLDTPGTMRGSLVIVNHLIEDASISRKAFVTTCAPDAMPEIKTVAVAPGGKSIVPGIDWMSVCFAP